jgi:MFS family permease
MAFTDHTPPTNTAAGSVWQPPYQALTIGLMLTITVAAFETLAVSTILPAITRDLGGLELYGWAFSAFLLTRLIGTTLAGAEADRLGPGIPFLYGVAIFVTGLLISGLAPNMPIMIAGRAVQGFGSGVISSVAYAIVARGYPESIRPRMLAIMSTAWVVPGLIGPGLAGIIGDFIGWRWVFLGLVPLPPIAAWMAQPALQSLARETQGPRDWQQTIRAAQLAIGTALLMYGLGQALPWGALLVAAGLIIGTPALVQLLPAGTTRAARGLPAAIACMGLLSMSFFGVDAFLPLVFTELHGLSSSITGLGLTAATMTWTGGSWLLDRYSTRFSRRAFAITGLILILLSIVCSIIAIAPTVAALFGVLAWSILGLGMGLTYTTLSLVTLDLAPTGKEGASTAALQLTDTLGAALGTGIGGVVIAAYVLQGAAPGIQTQFLLMLAVAGIATLIASRLPGRTTATHTT